MKTRSILFFLLTSGLMQAQDKKACIAGVYNTKDDFIHNRISHKINTGEKGYKFSFLFPADLKFTIKIEKPDTSLEFKPGSVYGYSDCGKKYRYYPGGDLLAPEDFYIVDEIGGLVIYSSGYVSGDEKFYSLDLSSPIHRLILKNIEADFSAQPEFLEAVKQLNKKKLDGITDHDDKNHYTINKLYAEKVKK